MRNTVYDIAADEMEKLLIENNIGFNRVRLYGGWQFFIHNTDGDIICHNGSFGGDDGLWESMGFVWDDGDVSGYLTAREVIGRLKENYGM